ncbi:Wadjet anti-phage system protein JetA family protein [Desulfotomaculum copahuensis]|uniref:Wadjet anti-phage system protein JetA family protein n=1 Tax=Desulfotomaculum copahuensis TaxID=1838280 RepID=UPI001246FAE2|nr:Wadjet anti-phage system protein JetA family protein [Desulfotomaculum copahuensis]
MNLFAVIPERLFSVLSSRLKEDYAAILFRIYDQYQLTTFGMERDVVIDLIVDYMEQKDQFFEQALADEIWEESLDTPAGSRDRAAFILRKLESTGWLAGEVYSNYVQYISLPDYAIKILDVLDKIRRHRQVEYQGFVYATYTLLHAPEADRQGNLALEKAYEQTEQLINGLKSLNHNIKRYIERVLAEKEPREILKIHFQDYMTEIIDQSYHRLKTSDNVSRYRPKIVARLNQWYGDPVWVDRAANLEVQRERYPDLSAARQGIYRSLDYIRQAYTGLDDLLEEIDRRNARYANASFQQLKYILNSSRDTEGQLTEILKFLAEQRTSGGKRPDEQLPAGLSGLFGFFTQEFLSTDSLYTGREAVRHHQPQEVHELETVDPARRQERLRHFQQRLERRMTREKINAWIMGKLAGREEIYARELGIAEMDDFIKLVYASAYSRSRRVSYRVERKDRPRVTAAGGSFEFKDLRLKRK